MWVCLCNSFNDQAVTDAIAAFAPDRAIERKEIKALYKLCTGGTAPNCGKCLSTQFLDLVNAHNQNIEQAQGRDSVHLAIPIAIMAPPPGAGQCGNCQCGKGGPRCI